MKLAYNYSKELAELVREGKVHLDVFKCPPWPEMIEEAQDLLPVYVHFPLTVGAGIGAAKGNDQDPVDWKTIESLQASTVTPFINLHTPIRKKSYPDIPPDSLEQSHIDLITENLIKDIQAVCERFGAEYVIIENMYGHAGRNMAAGYLPDVINSVIAETGCGFLFDISHARLAARELGWDAKEYIQALPLNQIRELHLTGVQAFDQPWIDRFREAGEEEELIEALAGLWMDHFPLNEEDWQFWDWCLAQINDGRWGDPWAVAVEYGGIGPYWQAMTDTQILLDQVPRLWAQLMKFDHRDGASHDR